MSNSRVAEGTQCYTLQATVLLDKQVDLLTPEQIELVIDAEIDELAREMKEEFKLFFRMR